MEIKMVYYYKIYIRSRSSSIALTSKNNCQKDRIVKDSFKHVVQENLGVGRRAEVLKKVDILRKKPLVMRQPLPIAASPE
jgi:hypothetical protein